MNDDDLDYLAEKLDTSYLELLVQGLNRHMERNNNLLDMLGMAIAGTEEWRALNESY